MQNINLPTDYILQVSKAWDFKVKHSTVYKKGTRYRWWQSPTIMRYYNNTISGNPESGIVCLIQDTLNKLKKKQLDVGISIGCGYAENEFELLTKGIVQHFYLFDFSKECCALVLKHAKDLNIQDRITVRSDNAFEVYNAEYFDLVFWGGALHHMPNIEEAVIWSKNVLKPNGIFSMFEYVGENRFQFSEAALNFASQIRSLLPKKYLKNPHKHDEFVSCNLTRPSAEALIKRDPSEAIDSESIVKHVQKYFPHAKITELCGVVFSLALQDIICNFNEKDLYDRSLLLILLGIDNLAINIPEIKNMIAVTVTTKI